MSGWRFPSNDYGENKGINDTGVAMFRGTPIKSLAREICQNSLDAGETFPVKIEFDLFEVESSNLPGKDVLEEAFDKCLQFWKSVKAMGTREHFENAKKKINKTMSPVLRISDFNTSGLTGSRKEINTNWTNLTKSSGSSDKKGTAGGSFGIGKFAPFACSDFSTVFYSTLDKENQEAYQGVSRLVTFTREDNHNTQGIGYFGNERNTPVYEQLLLNTEFERADNDFGTDIFVLGYKYAGEGWERDILISVLDGFLGAIWNERLEITVGDIVISKSTLKELVEAYYDDLTGYTAQYYETLISDKTDWYEQDILGLGIVKLGLLVGDPKAPKRVAMIRKTGMKIKDKDRLPGHVPFVGVMFIEGEKINQRLRLIENPEHTEWQPDRSKNPYSERELIKELNRCIIRRLEEIIKQGSSEEMDAVGVGSFLPDEVEEKDNSAQNEGLGNKIFEVEKKNVKRKPVTKTLPEKTKKPKKGSDGGSETPGEGDEGWPHPGGNTNEPGDRPPSEVNPSEKGNEKKGTDKAVSLSKFTPVCINKDSGRYAVTIIPLEDCEEGCIDLFLSAESQRYKAPLKTVRIIGGDCVVNDNRIKGISFKSNMPIKMSIEIDYTDYCSMEVLAYAIKK